MRYVLIALSLLVVTSCRTITTTATTNTRWVQEEVVNCPGGRVDTQKRIVDTRPNGMTRSTLIRTNTCLE